MFTHLKQMSYAELFTNSSNNLSEGLRFYLFISGKKKVCEK